MSKRRYHPNRLAALSISLLAGCFASPNPKEDLDASDAGALDVRAFTDIGADQSPKDRAAGDTGVGVDRDTVANDMPSAGDLGLAPDTVFPSSGDSGFAPDMVLWAGGDTGVNDTGMSDAGLSDTRASDIGVSDTGTNDTGASDIGSILDTMGPDAGQAVDTAVPVVPDTGLVPDSPVIVPLDTMPAPDAPSSFDTDPPDSATDLVPDSSNDTVVPGSVNNGGDCSHNEDCASSVCVDGMCCNRSCNDYCYSCKAIHTEEANGTCAYVRDGLDPYASCLRCMVSTLRIDTCDGYGACKAGSMSQCDGNLKCADNKECKTSCGQDTDCITGYRCVEGACIP
jgi:hypothetical protein